MMIKELFAQNSQSIERWFEEQFEKVISPFYASVDLRESDFKLAPVDVNLFPAGFNNLDPSTRSYASRRMKEQVNQWALDAKNILILPERHTRNTYYLENLLSLQSILSEAGFTVKLGTLEQENLTVTTSTQQSLELNALERSQDYLKLRDDRFVPDLILLNNDLSEGVPEILVGLKQTVTPPLSLGWHHRLKSNYFYYYSQVCQAFASYFSWESWWFDPLFLSCHNLNFMTDQGKSELTQKVEQLLAQIQNNYHTYGVKTAPYVMIKADSGSYGMGVLPVSTTDQLLQLPRKKRSHMLKTKGNRPIHQVIIQEGIPTMTRIHGSIAEPVLYLVGPHVVGGFYRSHSARDHQENLNAPGMTLIPMSGHTSQKNGFDQQRYAYEVAARLAVLAAAYEMKAH